MKKTYLIASLSVSALVFAGCSSVKKAPEPKVNTSLIMLTPEQAEARGIRIESTEKDRNAPAVPANAKGLDASAVVIQAPVKVYTVGRLVDAGDPDVMHESHTIYRREAAPAWRLQAPTEQQILVGPRITDGGQEQKPIMDQELNGYLADQRRQISEDHKAIEVLGQGFVAIQKQQQQIIAILAAQAARQAEKDKADAQSGAGGHGSESKDSRQGQEKQDGSSSTSSNQGQQKN